MHLLRLWTRIVLVRTIHRESKEWLTGWPSNPHIYLYHITFARSAYHTTMETPFGRMRWDPKYVHVSFSAAWLIMTRSIDASAAFTIEKLDKDYPGSYFYIFERQGAPGWSFRIILKKSDGNTAPSDEGQFRRLTLEQCHDFCLACIGWDSQS